MNSGIWSTGRRDEDGNLGWGWSHWCGEERGGFGNASTAQDSFDEHKAWCRHEDEGSEPR
jgi:hypothetical protein